MLSLLYAATVFLSAFLLFQVQPVIARMILPWFGGSSAVWTVCMLFFQVALLAGYAYAHGLHSRLPARVQAGAHAALLAASLFMLPVIPGAAWRSSANNNPTLQILWLLATIVGLPYFLLSTTSPLVQSWYARTHHGAVPYRLFSLSNMASLAALVSYPFAVEPYLPARAQALVWSWGYGAFAVLCAVTAWMATREPGTALARQAIASPKPGPALRVLWIGLAACASILFLSVTTYLTQDVASIPFLWILPLGLYLLTFVLCFESDRFYRRRLFFQLAAIAIAATGYLLTQVKSMPNVFYTVAFLSISLFVWCMTCHGELARLKPDPRHITSYYLMISAGGAVGGVFVGLIAPAAFNGYYEFPAGMTLAAVLMAVVLWRDGLLRRPGARALAAVLLAATLALMGAGIRSSVRGCRMVARNFYGQLRVRDEGPMRNLFHGVIVHGKESLDSGQRDRPTAYYCTSAGVGLAWRAMRRTGTGLRVGVVGLGAGTLAAYGEAGDTLRFYEINPLVVEIARSQFHFLGDTRATVEIALGDARLVLENEAPQQFDLLAIDAFSGDAVPVHLLTREAFAVYFRHIRPGGILAVHISNAYLNLEPVVASAAAALGKKALLADSVPSSADTLCLRAIWALVVEPPAAAQFPTLTAAQTWPHFRTWTDDYSSMFAVLRR